MQKIDFRKTYKNLYNPTAKAVQLVQVPAFNFAMVDGAIEPGHAPGDSPAFLEATQALYSLSYTLEIQRKAAQRQPHRLQRNGSGRPVVHRRRRV